MPDNFEQISKKPGFMRHNGGLMFRKVSENKYEFKNRSNGEKHIVDFDNLMNLVNS